MNTNCNKGKTTGAILNPTIGTTPSVHLAMFAKYWEAGKVKTRLARTLGADPAKDVHLLFVRFLLKKFRGFGDQRTLVATPKTRQLEFEKVLPSGWRLQFQSEGDLGQRMSDFFSSSEAEGRLNILIGSDTPDLPETYLQQCVESLNQHQLVLGPSKDGGYYLIAMRGYLPQLFHGIKWSSSEVLSETLEIAEQDSISYALLPELNDVDEIGDLKQLITKLHGSSDPDFQNLCDKLSNMELTIG